LLKFNLVFLGFSLLLLFQACTKTHESKQPSIEDYEKYSFISDSLSRLNRVKEALAYTDSIKAANVFDTDLGMFTYYSKLVGLYHFNKIKHPKLLLYIDSSLYYLEPYKNRYPTYYARHLRLKGEILFNLQAYDEAVTQLLKSKSFIDANLDSCTYKDFEGDIGSLLYKQGQYENSIYFYRESLKKTIRCEQDSFKLYTQNLGYYNNIALCFEKLNQLDSAAINFEKAIVPSQIIQNEKNRTNNRLLTAYNAIVYGNLGYIYFKLGDFSKAESLLKQSISRNTLPFGYHFDAILTRIKLAEMYVALQRFDEAKTLIDSLKNEPEIEDPNTFNLRFKKLIWLYNDAISTDKSETYKSLVEYRGFQDSISNKATKWQIFDINSNLLLKQNLATLTDLKEQQKINYLILGSVLVITFLLIIILYQIFKQSRFRKESLQNLEEFNEKLNQSYNELEISHSEKLKLVRIVAHDLRNPISGIVGFTDLIETESSIDDVQNYNQIIRNIGFTALKQIEDLLSDKEFQLELQTKSIEIDTLLQHSIKLCQFQAKQKGQKISSQLSPFSVQGDWDKLTRVFSNLLVNAIKFSNANSTIEVSSYTTEEFGLICIKDYGIGIPTEVLPILFSSDSSKMRQGTSNESSTGLGLVICKSIIEEHKGKIWAENNEEKGSSFFIKLPLINPEINTLDQSN